MGRFLNLLKKMQLLLEELESHLGYSRYSLISEIKTSITSISMRFDNVSNTIGNL